jgi:hypothetical protein
MPRPRTPKQIAEVTGAEALHPGRHDARKEPKVSALGPPPERLTETEQQAWRELADELPWLGFSDRTGVEIAAKLKARLMTDPDMGVNALAQLRMCLSAMGGFPADRSKVSVPNEEDDDPAAEFLN